MTIQLSTEVLVGIIIAYLGPAIAFIIWVKTEVGVLKTEIKNTKDNKDSQENQHSKENSELKDEIKTLMRKVETMSTTFTNQLYDLNTKITRAETLAEVHNQRKS